MKDIVIINGECIDIETEENSLIFNEYRTQISNQIEELKIHLETISETIAILEQQI